MAAATLVSAFGSLKPSLSRGVEREQGVGLTNTRQKTSSGITYPDKGHIRNKTHFHRQDEEVIKMKTTSTFVRSKETQAFHNTRRSQGWSLMDNKPLN